MSHQWQRGWGRQKPPAHARVDWSHPLARSLKTCLLFNEPGYQTVAQRTRFFDTTYGIARPALGTLTRAICLANNGQTFKVQGSPYGTAGFINGNYLQTQSQSAGTGAVDNLTWLVIFSPAAVPQAGVLLANAIAAGGGNNGYRLAVGTTSEASGSSLVLHVMSGSSSSTVFSDLTVVKNAWHTVVLRRAAGTWTCTLDGKKSTSTSAATPTTSATGFNLFQDASHFFNGAIASAFYWERALSDAEAFLLRQRPYSFLAQTPATRKMYPVSLPAPPTPPGPQQSQSGRVVTLVSVVGGNVYVANAGASAWAAATNTTGKNLNPTGVVRSASNNQKLWFADGTHWLYYDPSDNSVHNWVASSGSLPVDTAGNAPRLIGTWRGRMVLSGLPLDGQNWFMSAVSDPTNWNYAPTPFVTTQAVAGNNSPLGLIGDVITAIIPYTDDKLIFGGDHTVYQVSGDPADGGRIDLVTDLVGMAWGAPWAKDPQGTVYFVSNQTGIYSFQPGSQPVRISQAIEQYLTQINTGTNLIRCQWDDRMQGLHVFVTLAASASATTHFFWEQRSGAWWQDTFANNNHNPIAMCIFDGNTPADRRSLIGSWDGYVRTLEPTALDDDGTAIASSVVIGPLLTKDFDELLLKDMQAILSSTSGTVSWAVYTGATAEIALASSPVATGTWTAGRNLTSYVRRAGHAIYLKLTATSFWAMEAVRMRLAAQGKVRRRGY